MVLTLFLTLTKSNSLSFIIFSIHPNIFSNPVPIKMCLNSISSINPPNLFHNSLPNVKFHSALTFGQNNISLTSKKYSSTAVACSANGSEPKDERTARETVLKLYEAIKHKDVNELSDIITDECTCWSNIFSSSQLYHGKKQVLLFFLLLMKKLGDHIEFVVHPTLDDGVAVGVSWKLEWRNVVPWSLGKGFSLHTYQYYSGKIMINNVEIFMEPLLHMEPLRLKVVTLVMTAMEKLHLLLVLFRNDKARRTNVAIFIVLLLIGVFLLFKSRVPV